jgi:hypothetical protein
MKRILPITMFLALNIFANSDTTNLIKSKDVGISGTDYNNYFGVTAGFSTGLGLSYRRWLTNEYAVQFTFAPYYYERVNNEGKNIWMIGGLSAYKSFVRAKHIRMLAYTAAQYQYIKNWAKYDYYSSYKKDTIHVDDYNKEQFCAFGVGGGIEIYVWRLGLNLMVGIAPNFRKYLNEHWRFGIMVSPEAGLYLRF